MLPLMIFVAGDPVPLAASHCGSFAQLIRRAVGDTWQGSWREHDIRGTEPLPDPSSLAGVIITGSAASVTERAPWMLRTEAWLREAVAAGTNVFGICFGHQLLGQALGGRVEQNPRGREMGTMPLELIDAQHDPLLGVLVGHSTVNMSHRDSVVELPDSAVVLARTEREPHAALRFSQSAWGVQFHPEFTEEVTRDYIDERRETLLAEGQDPEQLLAGVRDCPEARTILRRFALHLGSDRDQESTAMASVRRSDR